MAGVNTVVVADDGVGMTLTEFRAGWMRVGTAAKAGSAESRKYMRPVTGEKGIGRFAVRFLGASLKVRTVADDPERGIRTVLEATFDWTEVDRNEDLGRVTVPFSLRAAQPSDAMGTILEISDLRVDLADVDWNRVRTASISLLSPVKSLLAKVSARRRPSPKIRRTQQDPGFTLAISGADEQQEVHDDVAAAILDSYVHRAVLTLSRNRLTLVVFSKGEKEPRLSITDKYVQEIGNVSAEIRFFPKRKGTFSEVPLDGRRALGWVVRNSGVAVYDRSFRVQPYGTAGDDWLGTAQDTAVHTREPRSSIAKRHFPMTDVELKSTELNYMLRLPHPQQLIGVVSVESARTRRGEPQGLIPAADREGFVDNKAFRQLKDVVRGAVEAIAHVDRQRQKELEELDRRDRIRLLRKQTRQAIKEIQNNPRLRPDDRKALIDHFARAQEYVEEHELAAGKRESQLQVLSLLGVVAGFMTHEFGVALDALVRSRDTLTQLSRKPAGLASAAKTIDKHIATLRDFAAYSRAYIGASSDVPEKPYLSRARIQQIVRIFGAYASERGIDIEIDIASDLLAPLVPAALYNGIALNLYTNALKALGARAGDEPRRISFRAWNSAGYHTLMVSDTGIGIPSTLRDRVFMPLFSTTRSNSDPLGSGLGLGLTLVKRAVETHKGKVSVVDPPPGFTTAVEVRLPVEGS